MDAFDSYIESNKDRFTAELQALVRQPSISAQNIGIEETAQMVATRLRQLGAAVQVLPVPGGPPVVFGEIGDGPRTLMIYDHYDVQPPEPLELWHVPPFSAEIRDGKMYGRGTSDNKGNFMSRVQAVEAWLATRGPLPLKIKFVVEGEEETGSPHLAAFAAAHRDILAADGCLWESGGKDINERFIITLGLKGICYLEMEVKTANRDLHSAYATIVPDAAWRLVWALSTMKTPDDFITVAGLMDHVAPPSAEAEALLRQIPFDEARMRADWDIAAFNRHLSGYELLKKHLFEPTCTICGFLSGYTGPGSKTVLPNVAMAKIDFRLVPDLTPAIVLDLLRKHLDAHGFSDVIIRQSDGERPALSPVNSPLTQASIAAAKAVYGQDPVVYPLMAGSGPMYPLCQAMGIPTTSGGAGYAGANTHAPDENIRMTDYWQAIRYVAELIRQFAAA